METKDFAPVKTDALFEKISALIEEAIKRVITAVNVAEVYTKYEIGRYIVEDEQKGKYKAMYGKKIIENLSQRLGDRFGGGWSVESLKLARRFYMVYSGAKIEAVPFTKTMGDAIKTNSVNTFYQIQNTAM